MTNYLHLPEQERLLYTEFLIRKTLLAGKLPDLHLSENAANKLTKDKIVGLSLMAIAFVGITCSFYYLIENWKQKRQLKNDS